ncbi:leucine-rich melanocyte differentiation-associated protein-like isoform X2 [Anthonomus grandis grandis]|uniref:leucine-rich melanocyte differentiation-associated protein-like isoform X2 n=1 Tax=Anthonomus grandis grandis TaxID=2921223 RepID=UPI0021668E28|nr:leucine-rich melanocyte differentiation-associated protein-like isoform X2 [Anthonomus grandis grandis]
MDVEMLPSTVSFVESRLCYCGQSCTKIPEALTKLYAPKVHSLDLSYNELVTLRGLEHYTGLKELVLDNNQLGDNLVLPHLENLHTMSMNKNKISNLEGLLLQIKEKLPQLSYLSLLGNQACPNQLSSTENDDEDYQRYRYFVLHHLPNLKFLDSTRVTSHERTEARSRGKYMNVVTPSGNVEVNVNVNQFNVSGSLKYTPLPKALRSPEDYKGAYGKCRYRYSGKHSEGNRFILNNDL